MRSRQLIVHGHIAINGRKVTIPGYMVKRIEEGQINYHQFSPLAHDMHPARPDVEAEAAAEPEVKPKEDAKKPEADKPPKKKPAKKPPKEDKPVEAKKETEKKEDSAGEKEE